MLLAGLVEGRATIDLEMHPPSYDPHTADEIVALLELILYGHKVQHLGHALWRQKTGQKHVSIRQVELLAASIIQGAQLKVPAFLVIQNGGEDARGVEPGETEPVYRPVDPHQRRCVQIPYYPMIFYRKVSHALLSLLPSME